MKKLILILFSMALLFSCKKISESNKSICDKPYTNYYVLTSINQVTLKKTQDNYYIKLHKNDTCNYSDYYVSINLDGYMVSEEMSPQFPGEKKYFINILKEMDITSNKTYNSTLKYYYWFHRTFDEKNFPESIGYSPIELHLTQHPDSAQLFYFNIELIDNEGHHFSTTTTPVYITE